MTKSSSVSLSKVQTVAVLAAKRAAKIQRDYFQKKIKIFHKGEVNLLTQVDLACQKVILKTISAAFPQHEIFAEEDQGQKRGRLENNVWVVDPLDGTTNYAHKLPIFSISIAYREKGQTLFGLVCQPILDEWFVAIRGRGAKKNGKKIFVSQTQEISKALLVTGFPYDRKTSTNNNLDLFSRFELLAVDVRRLGSAALDLAYVACGRLDGFWEPKLHPWDIAAGCLLVEEAKGIVTDYSGRPLVNLECGEIVASSPNLHPQMIKVTHP